MLKKHLLRAWVWVSSGWGALSLFGSLEEVLRWLPARLWRRLGDVETLRSLWEWVGGDMPSLIWVATNPFFGFALIIIGLLGIPVVARSSEGHPLHPVWPILGWSIFIACASILVATLLFGEYATSSGVVEAKRFYTEQHTERHFTDSQKEKICNGIKSADLNIFRTMLVTSDVAPESIQYATELYELLKRCGARPANIEQGDIVFPAVTLSPKTKGFYILTQNTENPPVNAVIIFDILHNAGFIPQYFLNKQPYPPLSLYVGPK